MKTVQGFLLWLFILCCTLAGAWVLLIAGILVYGCLVE